MTQHTVNCGCGRSMSPDGRHGPGAYRCGCGARVTIRASGSESPPEACVGEHQGRPCRMPAVTDKPFRLCLDHYRSSGLKRYHEWILLEDDELARQVAAHRMQELIDQADDEATALIYRGIQDEVRGTWYLQDTPSAARARQRANDPENNDSVYFIRHGNNVKIGKSVNVKNRLGDISVAAPGAELLATEPGYTARERALHSKFAFYRTAGEWFALGPGLVAYINDLRKAAGQKPIPVPKEHVDKIRHAL